MLRLYQGLDARLPGIEPVEFHGRAFRQLCGEPEFTEAIWCVVGNRTFARDSVAGGRW